MSAKSRTVAYWTTTIFTAILVCLAGGMADLFAQEARKGMAALGYPAFFVTLLGAWKVLGGLTLLAPRFPRLKEWAYAGIVFDLTGATVTHIAVGDPPGKAVTPLVLVAIALASWWLRPPSRRLEAPARSPAP